MAYGGLGYCEKFMLKFLLPKTDFDMVILALGGQHKHQQPPWR